MARREPFVRLREFQGPFGSVSLEDGTTVVAESKFHRLRQFGADGTDRSVTGGRGTEPGRFETPRGLGVVSRELIAVADSGNARVQIIRVDDGKCLRTVSAGQLKQPWDVTCTPEGDLFVADMGLNAVKVFSSKGKLLKTFPEKPPHGEAGKECDAEAPLFHKPCRIEYHEHSQTVHVADNNNTRMHAISLDLEYVGSRVLDLNARPW